MNRKKKPPVRKNNHNQITKSCRSFIGLQGNENITKILREMLTMNTKRSLRGCL